MVKKIWQLARMAIVRKHNLFEIITPSGGQYQLDQRALETLLDAVRGLPVSDYQIIKTCENEGLIENVANPEQPFNVDTVRKNIADESFSILTLSDLALLITRKCNYSCLGCSSAISTKVKDELSLGISKRIISDASKFGALNLAFTGGEVVLPSTVEKVCALSGFAKENGYKKIVVASNGTFVPKFIKQLKESGVTRISLSYYLNDEYGREYTGCKNPRANTLRAADAILNEGMHLGLNCVITRPLVQAISRIVSDTWPIVKDVPHSYVRFSPLIEVGDAKSADSFQLRREDYRYLLSNIKRLKSKYGNKFRLTCDEECKPSDPVICDAGLVYAIVNNQGAVAACDLLEESLPLGNIRESSFFDIWNNDQIWKNYRTIEEINSKCRYCSVSQRKICFGKCRALSYLRYGSLIYEQNGKEVGMIRKVRPHRKTRNCARHGLA